jgi:ATP/maltotriose-dependent transcriptional regulator MalT
MRQTEILGLVADGLTNAEIADRLVVSKRTIDNHLTAILAQLDVASRQAAVESARRVGALDAAKRAAGQGRSTHVPESATTE